MIIQQEPLGRARRLPVGAEVLSQGGVHFRVWAPAASTVSVKLADDLDLKTNSAELKMEPEADGYFSVLAPLARPGMHYKYVLPSGVFPDPASRFQPDGPHGASQIVDPASFPWTDSAWKGVEREGQVIYEMHIGTFTREGNWAGGDRAIAGSRGTRHHPARSHAGGGFSRALRLGLRWREPLRADPALRIAR